MFSGALRVRVELQAPLPVASNMSSSQKQTQCQGIFRAKNPVKQISKHACGSVQASAGYFHVVHVQPPLTFHVL